MSSAEPYRVTRRALWGDMDFNGHMANRAYLDAAADTRMLFFAANGFPMAEFSRLRFGPVILKDELEYFRELHLLDEMTVTLVCIGLSEDWTRFRVRNEFFRVDDEKCVARITSTGGWLDLDRRRLTPPPEELRRLFEVMPRSEDFGLV